MERYDPKKNKWEMGASMLTPRSSFGTAFLNGCLYAVGGRSGIGVTLSTVERYDPFNGKWECVAPMSTERRFLGVAVLGSYLYAVGGGGQLGQLGEREISSSACGAVRPGE
jgi:hypothetical protein